MDVVASVVGEVTRAPIINSRRILDGEQNEVYDVTMERAPSVIVRIAHDGAESHDREAWVVGECRARGIPAPRVHAVRRMEVDGEVRSVMVMEKLPGERLADLGPDEVNVRRVLREVGEWLKQLHAIPVHGLGNLDGSGVGEFATPDQWLANVTGRAKEFEEAGRSVGLAPAMIHGWLREIVDTFRTAPPRMIMSHNDLLAIHVLVHDGRLSGIIDFGVAAAEPVANDFAKWDFREGSRFPVEWILDGYGDPGMFRTPNDRSYRALWLLHGLWYLRHYHVTGLPAGVEAGRDRLLSGVHR
ncbi:hypothetical protein GCM10011575_23510 [Microlunatus endophyticus]|uniref:Aminoglycoside phosphotransferase domain-containing protein n=2 Tax=Microlunatus endophyticus TaxID=1716077 RepID=A0A917W3T0_9ACTN|nr:hypothetical protein GCM10011575_23510 [Microlunatus endophyticus]